MKHKIPQQYTLKQAHIPPQSVAANATVNGAAIEIGRIGRAIEFEVYGGAYGAAATATLKLQGKRRDTAAWEDLLDKNGAVLAFPPAILADTGLTENNRIPGTFFPTASQAETYSDVRCSYTRGAEAVTTLIAVGATIIDMYSTPNPVEALVPDQLAGLQLVGYPA